MSQTSSSRYGTSLTDSASSSCVRRSMFFPVALGEDAVALEVLSYLHGQLGVLAAAIECMLELDGEPVVCDAGGCAAPARPPKGSRGGPC